MQTHNLWHPPPPIICTLRHTGLCGHCTSGRSEWSTVHRAGHATNRSMNSTIWLNIEATWSKSQRCQPQRQAKSWRRVAPSPPQKNWRQLPINKLPISLQPPTAPPGGGPIHPPTLPYWGKGKGGAQQSSKGRGTKKSSKRIILDLFLMTRLGSLGGVSVAAHCLDQCTAASFDVRLKDEVRHDTTQHDGVPQNGLQKTTRALEANDGTIANLRLIFFIQFRCPVDF